jgi:hypothetical protein
MPAGPVDGDNTKGHQGRDGMGEHMLDTGNIEMKGSIAQSTIDTFNFIFDVRPAGKGATEAGQGQAGTVCKGDSHGNKDVNPEGMDTG